jgi:hypothetical protein
MVTNSDRAFYDIGNNPAKVVYSVCSPMDKGGIAEAWLGHQFSVIKKVVS